jgi:two-component system nitrate/nitrite response regulator NarL
MSIIRVLIADDHPLVRFAVRRCLEWEESVEVVGEASTGEEAVALARRFRPDAVLLDYQMPVLDGVAATETIAEEMPEIAILMLTGQDDGVLEEKATRAGVHRLIRKDEPPEALLRTLYEVLTELRQQPDDRPEIVIEPENAPDRNA